MERKEGIVAGIAIGAALGLMAGFCVADNLAYHGGEGQPSDYPWSRASAHVSGVREPVQAQRMTLANLKPFPEEKAGASAPVKANAAMQLPVRQVAGSLPGGLRVPLPRRPEKNQAGEAARANSKATGNQGQSANEESYSSRIAFVGGGSIDFDNSLKQGE